MNNITVFYPNRYLSPVVKTWDLVARVSLSDTHSGMLSLT